MPFYAEHLYQGVKTDKAAESVHLCGWPEAGEVDTELLGTMRSVRELVTAALEARTKAGIKVRQPLSTLYVSSAIPSLGSDLLCLIQEEVNVKAVEEETLEDNLRVRLNTNITPELKAEGDIREFMRALQGLRKDIGLAQQDRVVLTLQTTADGQKLIEQFTDEIAKTVGVSEFNFAETEGSEVAAGEHAFTVAITKV